MNAGAATTKLQTGHVGLNVTDIERAKRFYQDVFDFDLSAESESDGRRFVFLSQKEQLVLTLWQQSTGRFATDRPGLHHLSFQVDSIEEVKKFEERLKTLGVSFAYEGIVPHREGSPSGGIFFFDPDGIRLEVYAPTGAEGADAPVKDAPSCGFF